MKATLKARLLVLLAFAALLPIGSANAEELPSRVTILYDAFGKPSSLKRGWGYASLVEYGGKRILFDTGGDLAGFTSNVEALGVDLSRLDFVVITHRHGDHTSGLHEVLKHNPDVRIYTPAEPAFFDTPAPPTLMKLIQRRAESAPDDMHYFDGKPPERLAAGTPWPGAKFTQIQKPTEIFPGFWLFATRSETPGTREMNELSMAIKTPDGLVLMVGCSHPGIETILGEASKIDARLHTVFGGLHLVELPDAEVTDLIGRFRDKWKIERAAAGHCSGEFAFAEFARLFGAKFEHAGVGAVIPLPARSAR